MGRPKPKTIAEQQIGFTRRQLVITDAEGYWIVVYRGEPVNIVDNDSLGFRPKKYVKNGWAHEHSAHLLANKLNRWFNTEDFTVLQVL